MKNYSKAFLTVASTCMIITLLFYRFITDFLSPVANKYVFVSFAISFLTSLGLYISIFRLLVMIYTKYIHFRLFKEDDVRGTWFSIVFIENDNSIRIGKIEIVNNPDRIYMAGDTRQKETNTPFQSQWHSEVATIIEGRLFFTYESIGAKRDIKIRRGTSVLQLHGTPPKQMTGIWSDMAPSPNHGSVVWYKEEKAYKEALSNVIAGNEQVDYLTNTSKAA